jgi:hypothetical protein
MPKIFEYFGFVFLFYSNDHKPLHVHARYAEYESVIELEIYEGKLVAMKTIHVERASYIGLYRIELEFNDKTKQTIDFGDFLIKHPHPQHDKYRDLKLFKQFKIEDGNIVWGENWDLIFPIYQLYKGKLKA